MSKFLEKTLAKVEANKPLTLREWQINIVGWCSAFWHDFFPEFCKSNGINIQTVKFKKVIWQAITDAAGEAYNKKRDEGWPETVRIFNNTFPKMMKAVGMPGFHNVK